MKVEKTMLILLLQKVCTKKNMAWLCFGVFVLSLIPVLYVGRYSHPLGDDISYGQAAHAVWEAAHSVSKTIAEACKGVADDYYRWQGTYFAMLLMRLQPAVFSENWYFLTPFLIIAFLLYGSWYLLHQISQYVIPFSIHERLGIWSVIMFLSIQWVFSPGEAFYWYNGGMYYTGFFGLMLLMFGLLCKYANTRKRRVLILLFIMELLIGGGNYLTLLWAMIVLVLTAVLQCLRRRPERIGLIGAAIFQIACFMISAAAPGNAIRGAYDPQLPAYKAILFSLRQGFAYLSVWINGWWILGAMILICFILPVIRKMSFRFPYPFAAVMFLYGMFCALSCPTFYAQSSTGPARVVNVCYYGFILTSYIAFFYLVGWVYNKWKVYGYYMSGLEKDAAPLKSTYYSLLLFALIMQLCIGGVDGTLWQSSGVRALQDILSGTASAYDQEYRERICLLETSAGQDVVLMPYQNKPRTIYVGDYGAESSNVNNLALAEWFGCHTIVVDYSSLE